MTSYVFCVLAKENIWKIGWWKNESSLIERGLLTFLLVLLVAIIIFNVIHHLRVSSTRKKDAWNAFLRPQIFTPGLIT